MAVMEKINSTRILALLFLLLTVAETVIWYALTLKR